MSLDLHGHVLGRLFIWVGKSDLEKKILALNTEKQIHTAIRPGRSGWTVLSRCTIDLIHAIFARAYELMR